MRLRAVWIIAVGVALAGGACSAATDDAPSPAPSADSGASDGSDAGSAGDGAAADGRARGGDAGDASALDAGTDAADADAGLTWLRYEFPETGFPNGWLVANQGNSPNHWGAASFAGASTLNMFTDDVGGGIACADNMGCTASQCVAGTCRQRVKQKSPRSDFAFGAYQWRVFVPARTPSDAEVSAGAFVYADDEHELDFECGPGTAAARSSVTLAHLDGTVGPALGAEMICYATSQANPFVSTPTAVPGNAWHTLELAMTPDANAHFTVTWRIAGVAVETKALTYGPADACEMYVAGKKCTWQAFISVENLGFIGDTYPTTRNDAHFDWFQYGQ